MFVAQSPEAFGYDLDGNLTNDGRWVFTWDAENRLTQIESLTNGPTASKRRVTWQYDAKGRRQRQTTYDLSSGSAVVTEDLKFVNDGWRCLAELNSTNNYLVRRYTWGLDLSGSMDGAGGVGGLLWMKTDSDPQFCAYDGNGNVAGLVRGSTGDQTAAYEYDPFGRTIRMTGVFAQSNPFRFSTKRANDTSDLVLYEYRVYNPSTGKWLSRDPLGEYGGLNLNGFCANTPLLFSDRNGLDFGLWTGGGSGYTRWNPPSNPPATPSTSSGFFDTAYDWTFNMGDQHVKFSDYDPGWGPSDFPNFTSLVKSICRNCGSSASVIESRTRNLYDEGPVTITMKGGPGRYNIVLEGTLLSHGSFIPGGSGCSWMFRGRVYAPRDRINFDPENPGRGPLGQLITTVVAGVHNLTGIGTDYWLYFDGDRKVSASGTCSCNPIASLLGF